VQSTGINTQLGRIGKSLETIKSEDTLLSKEIRRIVRLFAILGTITCLLLVLIYGLYYGVWLKGILAGLTLSISLIPEEFPVVLTLFLTLGAWRISRLKVLARRPDVIETLGSATVLCSDKTGTITMNKMQVQKLYAQGTAFDLDGKAVPQQYHELIHYALLASTPGSFDPMEKAIRGTAAELNLSSGDLTHVKEYPLSHELMSMAEVWDGHKDMYEIAAKGAPEAIFMLSNLKEHERYDLEKTVHAMASQGSRVLGVARATHTKTNLPANQQDFDFQFCGLIGFADPIRETVPASIQECYAAGIRVIMITGDYPATAKHIAEKIGIVNAHKVITGPQIDALGDAELAAEICDTNVFSRVVPHQKLRLVQALKAQGEIVAMTGDGVNDAPALKAAHIGIAMGQKGTDVAREASDIVLLNDDFTSIVAATRMGRRIFANLQKAISYIIAIHVPIAGLALIPVFGAGLPVVLFPVHVAFFELLTDPILSIAFEAEKDEKNSMRRPPRKLADPMLGRSRLLLSFLQGVSVLAAVLIVYFFLISRGHSADDTRTITFATMMAGNLGLVLTNRSWSRGIFSMNNQRNNTLFYLLGGGAVIILFVFYMPAIRDVFHFTQMHWDDLLLSSAAGLFSVAWFEVYKRIRIAGRRN
jgi:Ca2+-transporting ATPase